MATPRINYRNLPQLLLKAREELLCNFRPIINHFGLTEPQWRILRSLSEHEQLEPREICDICSILSPSLAGMLARMEDMGLVERTRFPDDQRRVRVTLTERSRQIVMAIAPLIEEQYRYIEEAFGPDLIRELYQVIDQVITAERGPIRRVSLPPLPPGVVPTNEED